MKREDSSQVRRSRRPEEAPTPAPSRTHPAIRGHVAARLLELLADAAMTARELSEAAPCSTASVYHALKQLKETRKVRVSGFNNTAGTGPGSQTYELTRREARKPIPKRHTSAPKNGAPVDVRAIVRNVENAHTLRRIEENTAGDQLDRVLNELNALSAIRRDLEGRIAGIVQRQRELIAALALDAAPPEPEPDVADSEPSELPAHCFAQPDSIESTAVITGVMQ